MPPVATVDLKATSQTLHQMAWTKGQAGRSTNGEVLRTLPLTRANTFPCIALFEPGTFEIGPRGLGDVMALATGDSIYISAALLCDPFEMAELYEV